MPIGDKNPWDSDRKPTVEDVVKTFEDVMRKHSIPPPPLVKGHISKYNEYDPAQKPLPPLGEGHKDLPLPPKGDPRFHALLKQIGDLHDKKQQDYGRGTDAFANVRASQEFGVASWIGCMIRAQDKLKRLQTYAQKGTLANEGVEDSFLDLAVYALIGLILFRESTEEQTRLRDR
jgi:hypothetical protein